MRAGSPGVRNSRGEGKHGKGQGGDRALSQRAGGWVMIGGGRADSSNREVFSRLRRFLAPQDETEMGRE